MRRVEIAVIDTEWNRMHALATLLLELLLEPGARHDRDVTQVTNRAEPGPCGKNDTSSQRRRRQFVRDGF